MVGRKEPSPSPAELIGGIFSGQSVRKHQRGAIVLVALPDGPGNLHLLNEFGHKRSR
jgi:hypothetical protein